MLRTDRELDASIARALIDNTPASLLEVRYQNGEHIRFEFVFDGAINEDDREMVSIAETEMISDLYPNLTSESRCIVHGQESPSYTVAYRRLHGIQ